MKYLIFPFFILLISLSSLAQTISITSGTNCMSKEIRIEFVISNPSDSTIFLVEPSVYPVGSMEMYLTDTAHQVFILRQTSNWYPLQGYMGVLNPDVYDFDTYYKYPEIVPIPAQKQKKFYLTSCITSKETNTLGTNPCFYQRMNSIQYKEWLNTGGQKQLDSGRWGKLQIGLPKGIYTIQCRYLFQRSDFRLKKYFDQTYFKHIQEVDIMTNTLLIDIE